MTPKQIRQNYLFFTNASKMYWKRHLEQLGTSEADRLLKDIKQYEQIR